MENEIIIDDVDVSECEYMLNNKIKGKQHCPAKAMPYAKETSCICRKSIDTPYNFCKHNPNCHYKQLKRKEFELKILKADYEASEQENKELKSALEEIRELAEKSIKISYNLEVNSMLYDIIDKINEVLECQDI
jgi:hypothetical protein